MGGAIIFAPWFVFFNIFGFRFLFAVSGVLIFVFCFLITRLLTDRFGVCVFSGIIASLNSYILSINNLNPNILGMMIISVLIFLLIRESPEGFISGLLYGALGGIRNEAVLFFPAILYRFFSSSEKKGKEAALFVLGTLITIAPILYWNYYAFGNPFMHPTQSPRLEGFRPVFEHQFLFWKFNFNGMLNFPFYDKIVRTPYFPFPTFFLLPLTLISSFGIIISVFAYEGITGLFKKHRRAFIFLVLWLLPMYLLLSVQENWSNLKMTFLLLCLNPIVILVSAGLENILSARLILSRIAKIALLSALLFIAVRAVSYFDFSADERWYTRFPRAVKGTNISYIGDDLRTKKEDPGEVIAQKKNLTRGNFLPQIPNGKIDIPGKISLIKQEMNQRDITVVDFWKYIYEK